MIILKQVIHYPETNSVEATWVDRAVAPDTDVPEVPAVLDGDGNVVTPSVPAHTVPGYVVDVPVKCHSYADVQMDMLRADLGADAAAYSSLIATVEDGIVPVTPKAPEVPERIEALQGLLVLDSAGLGPAYEAWALSPDRTFAQKAFINKATHWKRTDPTLLAAATALGLTRAQMDAFFIDGATR